MEKNADDRNEEERQILEESSGLIPMVESKLKKALVLRERNEEKEDPPEILREKCLALAQVIKSCHNLIIYSGAGISTSAKIPDYRGPNGVWTQLSRYKRIVSANMKDLVCAGKIHSIDHKIHYSYLRYLCAIMGFFFHIISVVVSMHLHVYLSNTYRTNLHPHGIS